ncbi:TonB-dependent receptor plug domain-containing protein [Methylobacillus glycogenes]|uniref:TonB-dependent receptor plug domain-containing protein n=1 Tax=Methylobacillus glycogenes TaxID=406 RepID=UPI000AD56D8E
MTAKDIKEAHSLSITDLMNSKLQSVNVNDYQGNPFQMDLQYRGFTAGPQIGTPQGLSVFFDGIRVNEPFGDVVNWDMIPLNALSSFDVFPGSNPIFGLGT